MENSNQTNRQIIFQQKWWLDAVAKGRWENLTFTNKEGNVSLPIIRSTGILGQKIISHPPLTPILGPSFNYRSSDLSDNKKLSVEKDLIFGLIEQIPKFDIFMQNFHYSVKNWLPWYWKSFQQTTKYTYIIDDIKDLEAVWRNFQSNIKGDIKKAEKLLHIEESDDVELAFELQKMTLSGKNKKIGFDLKYLTRLVKACRENNSVKIFFAKDVANRVHSAIVIVWDEQSAYYLIGGSDPSHRGSGANSLLIWHAIKDVSKKVDRFDFEGSMLEGVERFFRGFGAIQTPYMQVYYLNRKSRIIKEAIGFFKEYQLF